MNLAYRLPALILPLCAAAWLQYYFSWKTYKNPFDSFLGLALSIAVQIPLTLLLLHLLGRGRPAGKGFGGLGVVIAGVLISMGAWIAVFTQQARRHHESYWKDRVRITLSAEAGAAHGPIQSTQEAIQRSQSIPGWKEHIRKNTGEFGKNSEFQWLVSATEAAPDGNFTVIWETGQTIPYFRCTLILDRSGKSAGESFLPCHYDPRKSNAQSPV